MNYSLGMSIDMYIHRTGRCGRAGRSGLAHTFVVDGDERLVPELIQVLRRTHQPVPYELQNVIQTAEAAAQGGGEDEIEEARRENKLRQQEALERRQQKGRAQAGRRG